MSYLGDKEFLIEVQKGNVSGHALVHKFGRNTNVAAGSQEGVLQVAANFNFLTAATTVRVKAGGNGNDVAISGSGAREVTVYGLDDSGLLAEEAISTSGTSASSNTTTSFWRVFRAVVTKVGTYGGDNDGNIVIENSAGGTDLIQVTAGEGQSQYGAYSIASAKTGYLLGLHAQINSSNNEADIIVYTRDNLNDTSAPMDARRLRNVFPGITGEFTYRPVAPSLSLGGWTDIWIDAKSGAGTAADVSVEFEILLVDD